MNSVTQIDTAVNTPKNDAFDQLTWLADQGARFALCAGRTKKPTETGWTKKPHSLEEAVTHANRGGNVGLMTGAPSNNIVVLDRDIDYPETIAMLGALANTTKIVRDNRPERGKLLYRIVGDLPRSTKWPLEEKHPKAEFLSTGRHAVIPPSIFEDGHYILGDQEHGILEITPEQMDKIWWMVTGESLDKKQRKTAERPTDNGDYVERVRNAWTTLAVFEHFQRTSSGVVDGRTETRLLGNGGLLINDYRWYCHSDGVGGDQFDAWSYCRWGKIIDRSAPKQFWDVVNDMAYAAGIARPERKMVKPVTKPAPAPSTTNADEDDAEEPAPVVDSGATLAALVEAVKGQDSSDLTSFKSWLIAQVPTMALLNSSDLTLLAVELRGRGIPQIFFKEALLPLIAEQRDDQQVETGKQADKLYKLAMNRATFFTGRQDSQVYASVEVNGHRECYRMRSGDFTDLLAYTYYTEHNTTVSAQAMEDCKKLLSFEAKHTLDDVFIRIGHHLGRVYIDLGSPEWDAIEVDAQGWRIVPAPPVHFRRSQHMLPLSMPVECPDPLILRKFLNIHDEDWPLVAAWLIAASHPRGPYPVLAFLSRAGSAKSTQERVFKRILDPSSAELRSQPNDVRDLFIAAGNSWLLAFDNVSHISPEVSDAMCVISTGGGYTRKLNYADFEESVINVQRPQIINGIGDVITRQDLMDRTIVVGTPTIPEAQRQDENEFWERFEQEKPKILGAFLFALSVGLANVDKVKLAAKPRMADFAKLAVAAEAAYTDTQHDFMQTYTSNREEAAETIIENSPLGDVLRRLVLVDRYLKLTPEKLFERIGAVAKDYEKSARGWPTAPNRMKASIERLAPALERQGVAVAYKRIMGARVYELKRL